MSKNLEVFNEEQQEQIKLGVEAGVNVSEYAKIDTYSKANIPPRELGMGEVHEIEHKSTLFNAAQMEQIRLGLMENVDTDMYSVVEYILFPSGNASKFPLFSAEQMKQIRLGMLDGIDVSLYAKRSNDLSRMVLLREIAHYYKNQAYPPLKQFGELAEEVHELNYDVEGTPLYKTEKLFEVLLGLAAGINIPGYYGTSYSAEQMKEIRLGVLSGIDVSGYANPNISVEDMRAQRLLLALDKKIEDFDKSGADKFMEHLDNKKFEPCEIALIVEMLGEEADDLIKVLEEKGSITKRDLVRVLAGVKEVYSTNYLGENNDPIRQNLLIEIAKYYKNYKYASPRLSDFSKMIEGAPLYKTEKLFEVLLGLATGIDILGYYGTSYSAEQMKEIRLGVIAGIDVSSYANPNIFVEDMRAQRLELANVVRPQYIKKIYSMGDCCFASPYKK